jgi:hypothetical protein
MLALPLLVLAPPATAAPCDSSGGSAPARICPAPPGRPGLGPKPVPTASAPAEPAAVIPSGGVPAPRISGAPAPAATPGGAPDVDSGALPPEDVPPTTASPAHGAPSPAPTGPVSPATQTSEDRGGRSVPGAVLLAFGGLLVAVWAFLNIRKAD